MKTWSYKEITEKAERRITELVTQALKQQDKYTEKFLLDSAFGVYLFWSGLTSGWQDEGDDERLESLTKPAKTTKSE